MQYSITSTIANFIYSFNSVRIWAPSNSKSYSIPEAPFLEKNFETHFWGFFGIYILRKLCPLNVIIYSSMELCSSGSTTWQFCGNFSKIKQILNSQFLILSTRFLFLRLLLKCKNLLILSKRSQLICDAIGLYLVYISQ